MDYLYVLQTLRESAPSFINNSMIFFSEYMMKALVFITAIIYWGFNKKAGVSILLGYSMTFTANQTIKNIACVYRPWIRDPRLYVHPGAESGATGYSFPSGHTVSAAYFMGSYSIWQKNRKWVCVICSFMILLIAFSRNWLGAHTLYDVLIALLNACLGLCITSIVLFWLSKHEDKDYLLTVAAVIISVLILIIMEYKNYPMDYTGEGKLLVDPYLMKTDCFTACGMTCGGFIGWILERRFVKLEDTKILKSRIFRILIGMIVLSVFMFGLTPLYKMMGRNSGHLLKYFLVFFNSIFVSPLLFKKFKLY